MIASAVLNSAPSPASAAPTGLLVGDRLELLALERRRRRARRAAPCRMSRFGTGIGIGIFVFGSMIVTM